jgi:hypothetical protein
MDIVVKIAKHLILMNNKERQGRGNLNESMKEGKRLTNGMGDELH